MTRRRVREERVLRAAKRACKRLGLRMVRLAMQPGVEVGWPDLMILGPNRGLLFIETKAPGGKPRPIQMHRGEEIRAFGHEWTYSDCPKEVGEILEEFAEGCNV